MGANKLGLLDEFRRLNQATNLNVPTHNLCLEFEPPNLLKLFHRSSVWWLSGKSPIPGWQFQDQDQEETYFVHPIVLETSRGRPSW